MRHVTSPGLGLSGSHSGAGSSVFELQGALYY